MNKRERSCSTQTVSHICSWAFTYCNTSHIHACTLQGCCQGCFLDAQKLPQALATKCSKPSKVHDCLYFNASHDSKYATVTVKFCKACG